MPPKAAKGAPAHEEAVKSDVNISYFQIRNEEIDWSAKITVNTSCRVDIILDYAKRQFVQKINQGIEATALATTDENKEKNQKLTKTIKEFQSLLQATATGHFVLQGPAEGAALVHFAEEDFEKIGATMMPVHAVFDFGVSQEKAKAVAEREEDKGEMEQVLLFLHTGQEVPPPADPAAANS
jgi:hypothetical protein